MTYTGYNYYSGNPTPTPLLVVIDQDRTPLTTRHMSNTTILVTPGEDSQTIYVTCFAGNEVGYLHSTKIVTVIGEAGYQWIVY